MVHGDTRRMILNGPHRCLLTQSRPCLRLDTRAVMSRDGTCRSSWRFSGGLHDLGYDTLCALVAEDRRRKPSQWNGLGLLVAATGCMGLLWLDVGTGSISSPVMQEDRSMRDFRWVAGGRDYRNPGVFDSIPC